MPSHHKPSIMLVDDEPMIAELLATVLRKTDFNVVVFEDGTYAWEAFKKRPDAYDLILSDVMMPRMDGPTLIRHIRTIRPDMPVIVLTGVEKERAKKLANELQVSAFLTKPTRLAVMLSAVQSALKEASLETMQEAVS